MEAKNLVRKRSDEVFSTRSRGRTGTTLLSLVFETNASTDSAIRANRLQRRIGRTKIGINSQFAIPNTQLFQSKPKKHGFSLGLCRGEKFCIKINFFIQSRFLTALRLLTSSLHGIACKQSLHMLRASVRCAQNGRKRERTNPQGGKTPGFYGPWRPRRGRRARRNWQP